MSSLRQERPIPELEAFERALILFSSTLELISSSPEVQSARFGHQNVSLELKSRASDAGGFLKAPSYGRLSLKQREAFSTFSRLLDDIPRKLLAFSATEEGNTRALSHESWVAVRVQASVLLDLLRPAIKGRAHTIKAGVPLKRVF
jgi:hypothetical protein